MIATKRRGYYTPREAAEEIGVSYRTLWRWRKEGKANTVLIDGTSVQQLTVKEVARLKRMWEDQNAGK